MVILEKRNFYTFSAIILKLILEYSYINYVNPLFEYIRFYLDINLIKYFESWVIYFLFLYFTPHILKQTSDFIINILFFSFLSPLLVFYALSNAPRDYLYIILLGILIIYVIRKGKKINISQIKNGDIFAKYLSILVVITVSFWLIFSGSTKFFNINFSKVYEFRSAVSSVIDVGIMSYLNTWAYKVFGPFLLIIFLNARLYLFASLIFLLHLFWFGVSSHKAVLFFPFLITFIYYWFRDKKSLSIIPISYFLVILFSYLAYFIFDETSLGSLFIRRVFFTPSVTAFTYYEFFYNNGFIYWSNSLTSSFFDYPYDLIPAKLIGNYIGTESHANNSFLATGYMHAGIYGIVLYSIIFSIIMRIYDSLVYSPKSIWISVAITIIPIRALIISADLMTALFTHGILISMFLLLLYRYKLI